MQDRSMRGGCTGVNSAQAVIRGLAEDGGQYLIEEFPAFDAESCIQKDTKEMVKMILLGHASGDSSDGSAGGAGLHRRGNGKAQMQEFALK